MGAGATGAGDAPRCPPGTGATGTGSTLFAAPPNGAMGAGEVVRGAAGAIGAGEAVRGAAGAMGAGEAVRGAAGGTRAGKTFLGATGALASRFAGPSLRCACASGRNGATGRAKGGRVTSDGVNGPCVAIGTRCGATGPPDVSASPRTAVTPPGAFQFAKCVGAGERRRSAATPTGRL